MNKTYITLYEECPYGMRLTDLGMNTRYYSIVPHRLPNHDHTWTPEDQEYIYKNIIHGKTRRSVAATHIGVTEHAVGNAVYRMRKRILKEKEE